MDSNQPHVVDDQNDSTVYQRGQQHKWTRARKADHAGPSKKQKREREHKVTEFTPRLDENGNPLPKSERRPKKKVAVMIGYCGTGYNGMQIQNNPDVKTIEAELFRAFVAAGAISPENSDDLKKNGFMRAARTDKGVHAAGNVVSAKLIIEDSDVIEKINQNLPEQIRVWGIERTNKSFDCRKMCSSRVYEYLLPTYTLLPPKPKSVLSELIRTKSEQHPGIVREDEEGKKWWSETEQAILDSGITEDQLAEAQRILEQQNTVGKPTESTAESTAETDAEPAKIKLYNSDGTITEAGRLIKSIKSIENKRRRSYHVSSDRLQLFRSAMALYEGSHNFHNFTLGKDFKEASARRYIIKTTVSEPFVIEGTEWVSIKLHGQSFMLHQIRKMIAMAVLVVRTGCPLVRITDCFGPTKVNVPKAPALGLLLENPVYEGYNAILEKHGYNRLEFGKYQKEMDAFKMKYIYDKIYGEEVRENTFYSFFGFIDTFKGNAESNEGKHIFDFLGAVFDSGLDENGNIKPDYVESDADKQIVSKGQDNVD